MLLFILQGKSRVVVIMFMRFWNFYTNVLWVVFIHNKTIQMRVNILFCSVTLNKRACFRGKKNTKMKKKIMPPVILKLLSFVYYVLWTLHGYSSNCFWVYTLQLGLLIYSSKFLLFWLPMNSVNLLLCGWPVKTVCST